MEHGLAPADVLNRYPAHAETLLSLLASRVRVVPQKPVLEFEARVWTYSRLDEASGLLARALAARGIGQRSLVALVSVNTDLSVVLYIALAKLRAIFVPLNPAATDQDLDYTLRHSRSRLIVSQPEDVDRLRAIAAAIDPQPVVVSLDDFGLAAPDAESVCASLEKLDGASEGSTLAPAQPDDSLVVVYTSGTTGFPKGVVHSQRNYVLAGEAFVARMYLQPEERLLALLPFFHINALFYSLGGAIAAGATLITARRFSASQFWRLAAASRATQFNFLAAVGNILIKRPRSEFDPSHRLRKMYGGPISEEEVRIFREEFGVPAMIEGYGMTEIPGASCNPFLGPHKPRSIGKPAVHPRYPGNFSELRIEDDAGTAMPTGETGELVVRTPIAFKEYLNDPDQTAAAFRNGWFLTGDLAKMDSDGYVYFVARKKDIIRRRGENIAGAELDRVIGTHPDVFEAAAIGVPSDLGEEEILVVVVPRPSVHIAPEAIVEWCRSKLSPMKVPRYVVFAETLPHTASHRVAKHKLKSDSELIARASDMEGLP